MDNNGVAIVVRHRMANKEKGISTSAREYGGIIDD
jgi:hypothetical protein